MREPSIAVITPFFNNSLTIKETLESVLNQTVKPDEIIIIDDGSDEENKSFLKSLIQEKPIKVFHQENSGPSTARNLGIVNSKSDYVIFLDSDDLMERDAIKVLKETAFNHPKKDVLIPKSVLFGEKTGVKNAFIPTLPEILKANPITICVCAKRALFDSGEFLFKKELNRIGLEDWEWWINLISNEKELFLVDASLFKIRVVKSSRTYKSANNMLSEAKKVIFSFHGDILHNNYTFLFNENKSLKKFFYFRLRRKLKKILKNGRK